jgi:3-oxoacyl-[acyl-carrier protein] reductase
MESLKNKVAVIFAASGEIAGTVARSFAQHGAKVYITAKNLDAIKALAEEIKVNGGRAEIGKVDAMNEAEIDNYLKQVVAENGKLDMVFNGIGSYYRDAGSGTPTTIATFEQFLNPLQRICGSQFLTSRAAARHMVPLDSDWHLNINGFYGQNQNSKYGRFRCCLRGHRRIDKSNGGRVWSVWDQGDLH